jgi:hypothetical protein
MIWIRTQDRETLIKCNYIDLDEININGDIEYGIVGGLSQNDIDALGKYKSKQRCLEVLDEIEHAIYDSNNVTINDLTARSYPQQVIYQMPKE